MNKKVVCIMAVILLAICLISGGCSLSSDKKMDIGDWKDLLSWESEEPSAPLAEGEPGQIEAAENIDAAQELIQVKLYFIGPDGSSLVVEERGIARTESIARSTMTELIKGPAREENLAVIPEGARLWDINLKPDGRCIVDLSTEICHAGSAEQEKLMVYAIANTLGQFATVKDISFMIDGRVVPTLAGFVDVSSIRPDYSI